MMFTVEESNLLQIIGGQNRKQNIDGLKGIIKHVEEIDMRKLIDATIVKLEQMTERDYLEYRILELEE